MSAADRQIDSLSLESQLPALSMATVPPADMLSAVRSLGERQPVWSLTGMLNTWTQAERFLSWARSLRTEDASFNANAKVTYAKRAVCQRIDTLVIFRHLWRFRGTSYPEKIKALGDLGIRCPSSVYDLVIAPRHDVEHQYAQVDATTAEHAVDVADLFLGASQAHLAMEWPMIYGTPFAGTWIDIQGRRTRRFVVPSTAMFLMVDCLSKPASVKIINGPRTELLVTGLDDFSKDQCLEFARDCRQRLFKYHEQAEGREFWEQFKTTIGVE